MLLPETKERAYRFTLALRMGLPIFGLVLALISHTLITNYSSLETSFYIESVLLLAVSVYFIFYLLYKGLDVKIRDDASGAFTREYLQRYLKKALHTHQEYTLIRISVENISDINRLYGIKAGDKTLNETVRWISDYFAQEKIDKLPIGHFQGGHFIIGLQKNKQYYTTLLELLSLKAHELKVDDIEVKIAIGITDTDYSHDLDFLIEKLFESHEKEESIDPSQLEVMVIQAIKNKNLMMSFQAVFENTAVVMEECFVKLMSEDGRFIYPKTYIKIVQKLGLRLHFDMMLLEESVQAHKEQTTPLALNISPTSLRNKRFIERTKEVLEGAAIKNIVFIVSEQEYYSFTSRYNAIITSLKSMGVMICIDRVGTYHTSFLYLRELAIDMIRYDSYYSQEGKIETNQSIIDGFNLIAKEKKIKTWIKNLQTKKSVDFAQNSSIDYLQGKYLADLTK